MRIHQDNEIDISNLYYKEVGRIPSLTTDKEKELRYSVHNGIINEDTGRELLINGNLRLVVSIAKRYADKCVSLEDLIQAGNVGLIEAANSFEWARDTYFSTFAVYYIKKEIILCLRHANAVALPDKEYQLCKKYEQYIALHDIPHDDESMEQCAEALGTTISKLSKLLNGEICTPICDGLSYKDDDGTIQQVDLPDASFDEDALCDACDSKSFVKEAASELPRREKDLLFLYYGISGPKMNYEQIGKKYRKNKQWAHREVQKAIVKLQSSYSIQSYGESRAV